MRDRRPQAVTLGEALIALQPEPRGPLRDAQLLRRHVGGAEVNVAVGLARLDHPVAWTGWVGDDELGRSILDMLRKEGVDVSRARPVPGAWTGVYFRETRPPGRWHMHYYRAGSAAAQIDAAALDLDFHLSGRILHLTGITVVASDSGSRVVTALARQARQRGVTVSFDANLRWRMIGDRDPARLLASAVELADLLFLSDSEADALIGGHEVADAERFRRRGWDGQVIVHGAERAFAVDAHGAVELPAQPSPVVDSVGAGDAFVAGFLAGRLRGQAPEGCLRMAHAAGACAVSVAGDAESMPRDEDLRAVLEHASEANR